VCRLSPGRAYATAGASRAHNRRLESLREYVLIAQERMRVEHYARQGEHWVLTEISDPAAALVLDCLKCELRLRDIYERVGFPLAEDLPIRA
jgi:hypothetical protein